MEQKGKMDSLYLLRRTRSSDNSRSESLRSVVVFVSGGPVCVPATCGALCGTMTIIFISVRCCLPPDLCQQMASFIRGHVFN